jgi:hypothetical protein
VGSHRAVAVAPHDDAIDQEPHKFAPFGISLFGVLFDLFEPVSERQEPRLYALGIERFFGAGCKVTLYRSYQEPQVLDLAPKIGHVLGQLIFGDQPLGKRPDVAILFGLLRSNPLREIGVALFEFA